LINIERINPDSLSGIRGVLTDIDDTLSTGGCLTADAYRAMWDLHEAGFLLVVVTGRPAGWCDHIARFWPVDAIIGENGGFYFHHDGGKLVRYFLYNEQERRSFRTRLDEIRDRILQEIPGCAVASDQTYREYDLAIDFCEDVEPLPWESVIRIRKLFEQAGATARISSIHVNGWFGEFNKLTTTRLCVRRLFNIPEEQVKDALVFCGDSQNDEPMFEYFTHSFGMANIENFLHLIQDRPTYITTQPAGSGFCEVAGLLLDSIGSRKQA
jgi:HAD superfamily hydrolase (TIGR01484 family)